MFRIDRKTVFSLLYAVGAFYCFMLLGSLIMDMYHLDDGGNAGVALKGVIVCAYIFGAFVAVLLAGVVITLCSERKTLRFVAVLMKGMALVCAIAVFVVTIFKHNDMEIMILAAQTDFLQGIMLSMLMFTLGLVDLINIVKAERKTVATT